MSQLNEKTTSIIYRSLVEAAERFYEKDPATALEIYRSFCRYAFCFTEDVETDNEIAELIVKQNVESLKAADRRYAAAVNNGDKGKDHGIKGKEYGKLGGRPRKGETREDYWERKRKEQETGEKEPYTPPVDEKRERAHNLARNYKKDDEKDGRGESTLTTGWIKKNIFSGQKCVYCGEEDWHKLGCDRIDNTKPHTPDNVVCSCSKCNIERGSMTFEEFKEKKCITPENPPLSPVIETPLTSALASSSASALSTTITSSSTMKCEKVSTSIEKSEEICESICEGLCECICEKVSTNTNTTDTSNTIDTKEYNIINNIEEDMRVIPVEDKDTLYDDSERNVITTIEEEKKPCTKEHLKTIYLNSFGELMSNFPGINYSLLLVKQTDSFYDCYRDIVNELVMKICRQSQRNVTTGEVLEMLNRYLDYIHYSY